MFDAVSKTSGLSVQLVYFRGFGECRASKWVMNASALRDLMTGIDCRGGQTQIAKVLAHAGKESARERIAALIFIGDAMEENSDELEDSVPKKVNSQTIRSTDLQSFGKMKPPAKDVPETLLRTIIKDSGQSGMDEKEIYSIRKCARVTIVMFLVTN